MGTRAAFFQSEELPRLKSCEQYGQRRSMYELPPHQSVSIMIIDRLYYTTVFCNRLGISLFGTRSETFHCLKT